MQEYELKDGDAAAVAGMLARFELFAALSPEHIRRAVPFVGLRRYEDGEVVIEKDDPGDAFYLIYSGEVEVTVPGFLSEKVVTRLGPGQFFGELALLLRQPRSATVAAIATTDLFVLKSLDFEMVLEREPDIAALVKSVAKTRFDER